MKLVKLVTAAAIVILLLVISCTGPAETPGTPTSTLPAEGDIIVTSTADSGPGTLRRALQDAESGDTITFDPAVFQPSNPATIYLSSELPYITQGNLRIDASNAGVILDGSEIDEGFVPCLVINSDGNIIRGLQIVDFLPGTGIILEGGAQNNIIGGDRGIGSGPLGQGNLVGRGDIGICLVGDDTSFNTITGNLIGTDASGTDDWGNSGSGICIGEGAKHNTIGPDNVIAYNVNGIEILDSNSLNNTVTQNSIHDNKGMEGVFLCDDIIGLTATIILDFDLAAGTVAGVASANSTVEIFSNSSDEGVIYELFYEGQTTADGSGFFTFSKGTSLAGPCLTATATDANGNTSEFSTPTSGTARSIILQEENEMPKTRFQSKQSKELADNHIGNLWCGLWQAQLSLQHILDEEITGAGLKWVRLAVNSGEVPTVNWDLPEFTIDPLYDDWITEIADNDVTIMYMLSFWDKENWPREVSHSRFRTEEDIESYLEFVRFIVRHFKDRVQYFEIWNEPNCGQSCPEDTLGCLQHIDVNAYINLVKRTVPVIREEYPEAKIVVGAVTEIWDEGYEYFFDILSSDIMPLVDAISWHPMYSTSPEHEYWREYYYNYPSIVQDIKDVASAHGFDGEYIAEELSWWTEETAPQGEPWWSVLSYTETVCEKYCARAIVMHLGLDIRTGICVSAPTISNLCTVMAGAEPIDLPVEIESDAENIKSYAFSLPNGDKLVALWTDGVAVDNDPGIEATLTIPGFSAQEVVGIDVLHGFEQELLTSMEDGNLVIENLLVKDYPIILHLGG